MRTLLVIFSFLFPIVLLNSQQYFNNIVPSEQTAKAFSRVYIDNENYIIPYIYNSSSGVITSLIITDNTAKRDIYFGNIKMGLNPLIKVNKNYYLVGENPTTPEDDKISCARLSNDLSEQEWYYEYDITGETTINSGFQNVYDDIYILNVNYIVPTEPKHRILQLIKIDTLGNETWSKNYNTDIELSYGWELLSSRDSNIFISAGVHYYDKLGRYAQLTKIDTSGNILWTYKGNEAFDNGAVPTWIAELSNGDIVMTYYIHGVQTPDIKLIWINKDGHYYKEKLIDVTAKDEFYFNQLEAGHGDYFFAYGFYRFFDNKKTFGILTKYDNDGNILWKHLYQHPDYTDPYDYNSIKDIEELDNGDIVVLGDLRHPGSNNEIWLFKINADGCYGTDNCPEEIVLSAADDLNINEGITIYPNPAQDILYIATHDNVKLLNVTLIAIDGKVISEAKNIGNKRYSMDVSAIDSGIYFVNVSTENGKVFTRKVIVD